MRVVSRLGFYLRSTSGRNNLGRLTSFNKGGGSKSFYYFLDSKRLFFGVFGKVLKISVNSNGMLLCLVLYKTGHLSYIALVHNLQIGSIILSSGSSFRYENGDCMRLKFFMVGSLVCNIELYPDSGAKLARASLAFGKVLKQSVKFTLLRLSSGECRYFLNECKGTFGVVAKKNRIFPIRKAGVMSVRGRRPHVRGIAKNPVDHPNGGRTKGGSPFCDMWGNLSIGGRTRCKRKKNFMIVRSRLN